ncbi:hypothetical protein AAFF_G00215930 [Aldrovandia affinis]|uniref:PiggyBac transposable element-derived protein domain-containing protein n=1 Tax=Aldrovandia affinis TaxID=143900 RepID=A0AAD7W4N7_9TELE|nr:hypothetical protein AAFF_G00215930 [Aldrovandia affinis]
MSNRKRRFTTKQAEELITQQRANADDACSSDSHSTEESDSDVDSDVDFSPESSSSDHDSSMEVDEDPEPEGTAGSEWKAKNGQVWSASHQETLRYFPATCRRPGPTRYAITRISDVTSAFELFITKEIIQVVVDMTNLQGFRTVTNWKKTDSTEIQAFIGLVILAGVFRSRNEAVLSLWNEHTGRPMFRATMSRKRFETLCTKLRFDDRLSRPARQRENKLAAILKLWEMWEGRLGLLFNPGQDICVDEQLVPFRGRCRFRQYIPNKPAKYGIKIWVACDVATSYAWKMQVYTGKEEGPGRR